MELTDYRRPPGDTGTGFHYTAAAGQGDDLPLFARWAAEMRAMHATWTTVLSPSAALAQRALALGLEPIHRYYLERPGAGPVPAEALHHQQLFIQQGGGRWVQDPHNETNNLDENPLGMGVAEPAQLAAVWVPWAAQIAAWGGYPSVPALSPGGTVDDLSYLARFLDAVAELAPRREGEVHPIWDRGAWVAVHNYCLNHPLDWDRDRHGFLGYRRVAALVFAKIGREIPVLSTEGGPVVGAHEDGTLPAVDEETHAAWAVGMVEHMRTAPRWYFGLSFWLIANYAAGFLNPAWESAAWFKPGRHLPAVEALRGLEPPDRQALWSAAPGEEEESRFFPETGFRVGGAFLRFFARHGLEVCGYPISEVMEMHGLPSQLFQRVIVEEPAPGEVRLKLTTDLWRAAEEKLSRIRALVGND